MQVPKLIFEPRFCSPLRRGYAKHGHPARGAGKDVQSILHHITGSEKGTGLGQSISHDIIVKQHNGSLVFDTRPREFTEFKIILPHSAVSLAKSGERS